MLRHSLLIVYRNARRNPTTFAINLIGLSTGLACVLMIALWVQSELDVDKFHQDDSRRYQVMENAKNADGITTGAPTPDLLASTMAEEIPEVQYATAVTPSSWFGKFAMSAGGKTFKAVGQFAGKDFFRVFPYDLSAGKADLVLSGENAIVISEELARRLFGTADDVIGRRIEWQFLKFKLPAVVSGVFAGLPPNSTEQFDFVLSFGEWKELCDLLHRPLFWGNHGPSTYLLLKQGVDVDALSAKIAGFLKAKDQNSNVTLFLRPYADNYLRNAYENGVQVGGRIEYVRLFSLIALFILLIACINFMNLSTAKATGRMKEVGIRKAVGAPRGALVRQYLGEAVLMAFAASVVALFFIELALPQFNLLTGKQLTISFSGTAFVGFVGIALITGLVAGSYPALYLSGFQPVSVLKGKLKGTLSELWVRKGLVVFQFSLSIILLVGIMVVFKQMRYIESKNLGFDRDNLLTFVPEGRIADHMDAFLSAVREIPGVVNAANMSENILGIKSSTYGLSWKGEQPGTNIVFTQALVGFDLLETLGIRMEAGRTFSRDFGADSSAIILNQAAVAIMGIQDPIGKNVTLWGKNRQIIGITENFNFESLHEPVKPFFFIPEDKNALSIMVRVKAGTTVETIERLQEFYHTYNPGFSFDYNFLDQDYQALYMSEHRVAILSRYFAGLAIVISCLGLFGLTAFQAERRFKEVGIRKVLGASVVEIIVLLSRDLASWVLLANIIAWPVAYYVMHAWLLSFAYRTSIGIGVFLLAGGVAIVIALATMSFQAIKAATANPVDALRYE